MPVGGEGWGLAVQNRPLVGVGRKHVGHNFPLLPREAQPVELGEARGGLHLPSAPGSPQMSAYSGLRHRDGQHWGGGNLGQGEDDRGGAHHADLSDEGGLRPPAQAPAHRRERLPQRGGHHPGLATGALLSPTTHGRPPWDSNTGGRHHVPGPELAFPLVLPHGRLKLPHEGVGRVEEPPHPPGRS
jgi:hypothetical protein